MAKRKYFTELNGFLACVLIFHLLGVPASASKAETTSSKTGVNLLHNSDFEDVDEDGKPAQWTELVEDQTSESSTEEAYSGDYSAKIINHSTGAGLRSEKIPVDPGVLYEASVMSYNMDDGSELYLEFWDSNNNRITPVGIEANYLQEDWSNITIQQEAPPNAVEATLLLYLSSKNQGTIYFDDASFAAAPPPDPLQPEYDHLVINTSKTLYQIGDEGKIRWYGTKNDGSLLDSEEVHHVQYESLNPDVVEIDSSGNFQVLSTGNSVITVKVATEDVEKIATITLRADDFSGVIESSKTTSTFYTDERRANILNNIDNYSWAKSQQDTAVSNAEKYVKLDDEQLWKIVTSQSVSRSLGIATRYKLTNKPSPDPDDDGISNHGNYPWIIDPIENPWKIKSPVTGRMFPTNDFEQFYESGIDEYGMFDYQLALKNGSEYLTNTENPESSYGVDDGWGWQDENNDMWTFIAYYNHWGIWYNGFIMDALDDLRDAYLYTGDVEYAYKGLILLDRVADVYPDLDVTTYPWSKGFDNGDPEVHTAQGKAANDIWETNIAKSLLYAYDAFFPEVENLEDRLTAFLGEKADQYQMANPKSTTAALRKNIEDNIVRIIYPAMKQSQIRGNMGMHQSTLALAAVVMDEEETSKEWLDYVFQTGELIEVTQPDYPLGRQYQVTGGDLSRLLVNEVDRDGMGNEAAPGYNRIWIDTFAQTAEILDGYERYPEFDLYKNVKFQKMFTAFHDLIMLGKYTPTIGDSGFLGSPIVVGELEHDILAFERWGDPELAQVIYEKNGNTTANLHGSILTEDPSKVAKDIEDIIAEEGPLQMSGTMMNGYGFMALRDGEASMQAGGTVYDFRDISIVSANRGTKYLSNYNAILFQNLDGEGAEITFEFEVPEDNEYDIELLPNKAPSYGTYTYEIDDEEFGIYDFYGGSAPKEYSVLATKWLTEGTHTLTFKYDSRHEDATGYYAAFKKLALVSKEEKEIREDATPDTQRGLWLYHGQNGGHGHKDTLNLGIHAYGMDLAPDLGYPDITGSDPKRVEWIANTISHNTVVVDESKQEHSRVGLPQHFNGEGRVQLLDVEAPHPYPNTEEYRRTTSMIQVDDEHSYAVDFFRVEGGDSHHYSFHSGDATVTTEGLELVPQTDEAGEYVGSYSGADVPFGQKESDKGSGSGYKGSGFHYLYDVDRASKPQGPFSVDWDLVDTWDIHEDNPNIQLRLTMLNDVDEVAIASGIPSQMNARSPEFVRYMVAERTGDNLKSTFTSVIEPYKNERYIDSMERVSVKNSDSVVEDDSTVAVKVVLKNGRTDYIIYSLDADTMYTIDDRIQFSGFFGVYSEIDGEAEYAYINDGTHIGTADQPALSDEAARISGIVSDFTKEMSVQNEIVVEFDELALEGVEPETLVGQKIYVETDKVRNGVYEIKGVSSDGENLYTLDIGDITLIRSYVNANDYDEGFEYDIVPGASFVIPLSSEWEYVSLSSMLEALDEHRDAIYSDSAYRSLHIHLTSVAHFEKEDAADKVVKHMESFQSLIDYQLQNEHISKQLHKQLETDTEAIVTQWQM